MIMMGVGVNFQHHATHSLTFHHDTIGHVFGIVDGLLDGVAEDNFAVVIDVVVSLAELHQRTIFERPLAVQNELLTVGGQGYYRYVCVCPSFPSKK